MKPEGRSSANIVSDRQVSWLGERRTAFAVITGVDSQSRALATEVDALEQCDLSSGALLLSGRGSKAEGSEEDAGGDGKLHFGCLEERSVCGEEMSEVEL